MNLAATILKTIGLSNEYPEENTTNFVLKNCEKCKSLVEFKTEIECKTCDIKLNLKCALCLQALSGNVVFCPK